MNKFFQKRFRQSILAVCVSLLLISAVAICILPGRKQGVEAVAYPSGKAVTIVIDPGHGGEDGGAVSKSGVKESNINLDIALKLEAVLNLYGVDTLMTRTEDISIYSDDAGTLRQKKRSDLKNRTELINSVENPFLVSIHQNSYTSSRYSGAQVFFSAKDPQGAEIAVYAQENLRLALNPDNKRQAAVISDSVYIMKNINCSGILVECGFMSNAREAELLQEPEYQLDIAKSIAATLLVSCV